MLRLWGRLSSINVRKVVWAAQELGLPLQRTDAGGQFGLGGGKPVLPFAQGADGEDEGRLVELGQLRPEDLFARAW